MNEGERVRELVYVCVCVREREGGEKERDVIFR